MKTTVFVPQKIKIGLQNRKDTYTGKLAYVVYFDQKGVLRKEKSWQTWRDQGIQPLEFDNIPTSGFVLNKKVGGDSYGWNPRQTYVRIYDPRNFEFEITIPNLLFILENTNSIKGKGLEGEFVYGWDGSDLVLLPTGSPDYLAISNFSEMITKPEKIFAKDLVFGGTYKTNKSEDVIYLGRFEKFGGKYESESRKDSEGLYYFFINLNNNLEKYLTLRSISGRIIKTISVDPVSNYADIMEMLESNIIYSPVDDTKTKYVPYIIEKIKKKFVEIVKKTYWRDLLCYNENGDYFYIRMDRGCDDLDGNVFYVNSSEPMALSKIIDKYRPCYRIQYLKNGKLRNGEC